MIATRRSLRNVNVDVIRRHRFTEEYRDILFSKILGEIKRMRKQCIPGLPPAIEGLGTRLVPLVTRNKYHVYIKILPGVSALQKLDVWGAGLDSTSALVMHSTFEF